MYSHSWNGYHQSAISIGLSLYALPYQQVIEKAHTCVHSVVCSSVIIDTVLSSREEMETSQMALAFLQLFFP